MSKNRFSDIIPSSMDKSLMISDGLDGYLKILYSRICDLQLNVCSEYGIYCIIVVPRIIKSLSEIDRQMQLIEEEMKGNDWIELDSGLNIVESTPYDFENTREHLLLLSEENKEFIYFFLGDEGVDYWFEGGQRSCYNLFYSYSDRKEYVRRYTLSQISDIFRIYQEHLKTQGIYSQFFESKTSLIRMGYDKFTILKNKPEKFMRDDLCAFLNEHVQGTFVPEYTLRSKKRNDISTEFDGITYIFEIKWIG